VKNEVRSQRSSVARRFSNSITLLGFSRLTVLLSSTFKK